MTLSPTTLTIAILIPLVLWRMYSRIRRMVGRQRLSRVRPWVTLVVFPLIIAMLALATLTHPERLVVLAVAVAAGLALARFGLSKTKFEPTPEGLFYTPNAHLGIALSLLFVGRILYRLVEMYALGLPGPAAGGPGAQDFARSPLTLGVFGLLAGYYVGYAIGLVRWRMGVMQRKREREAAAEPPLDGNS
jgi:hypothetical protein